jgi:hypothetical protein
VDVPKDDGSGQSFVIKQDEDEGSLSLALGLEHRYELLYPKQSKASSEQLAAVQLWLDELAAALDQATSGDEGDLFLYLDFDVAIDFVLLQELSKNIDAYAYSLYLSRAPGQPARLIPWDFDLSFGQPTVTPAGLGHPNQAASGWARATPFVRVLAQLPRFTERLPERWAELRQGVLSEGTLARYIDRQVETLAPMVDQNFALWPIECVAFPTIYPAYSLYRVEGFWEELSGVRGWLAGRLLWIDSNIQRYRG